MSLKPVVYSEEWHEFTQLVITSHMFTGLCCTYIWLVKLSVPELTVTQQTFQ